MTEFEKEQLYYALDKSTVNKEVIKHQMAKGGHFYVDTIFSFDGFRVVFTKYTPESKCTPLGHVCVYADLWVLGIKPELKINTYTICISQQKINTKANHT